MLPIVRALPLAVAVLPAAANAETPRLPEWMAGCWESRSGDSWAEECWTSPRGGMMLGSGRAGRGDRLSSWETMRIALDEPNADQAVLRMAFAAAPEGREWTVFAWSPSDDGGVEFVNAAHDFPQRIRYWRDGETLHARISALDGSQATEWTFARLVN